MSVTYGFYNSLNHDRQYNAVQMSSIFDGIIKDGVYMSIGDHFNVTAADDMVVKVAPGRAWFNHTWTLNDSILLLPVEISEVVLDRIDALIIEVNSEQDVRANSIKIIKGTPSSKPVKPTLTRNATVNQYALAYITVKSGVTKITQSNIEYVVGQNDTPYVTGLIETIDISSMVQQWEQEWVEWSNNEEKTANDWFYNQRKIFVDYRNEYLAELTTFKNTQESDFLTWSTNQRNEFVEWEATIRNILDQGAAGHLQNEIDAIREMTTSEVNSIFDN